MGWAYGQNDRGEEVGYGVEDVCHSEPCTVKIDRGMAYCCGGLEGSAFGGDGPGCGRYFCGEHLFIGDGPDMLCAECTAAEEAATEAAEQLVGDS